MTQVLSKSMWLGLAVTLAIGTNFAHAAAYAPVYQTTFAGANGTQPAGWEVLAGATGGASGWRLSNGDYRFDQPDTNALTHYTGPLTNSAGDANTLTDFRIQADFRKGMTEGIAGLAGRVRDAGNLYHARVAGDKQFQLYKFVDGVPTQLGSTISLSPSLGVGATWSMSMTFLGDLISAELFNASGASVAAISVTDASFASGSAGLRTQRISAYETFEIAVLVPEPSTFLLGGLGLLSLAGYGWRRRCGTGKTRRS